METTNPKKFNTGCFIGGIIGIIATTIILIPVFSILTAISMPKNDLKENLIKANIVNLKNEIYIKLNVNNLPPDQAISQAIKDLNNDKDLKNVNNPYDNSQKLFNTKVSSGSVTAELIEDNRIRITGYDNDSKEISHTDLVKH